MFDKLRAWWKLTRFDHALMYAFAVLLGMMMSSGRVVFSALLIPVFAEMGAFALNDVVDVESDRLNNRKRPLVEGTISRAQALWFSVVCLLLAVVLAFVLFGGAVFWLTVVLVVLAILYNIYLKKVALVGNAYIGFTMAIPFIFGALCVKASIAQWLYMFCGAVFLVGVGREVIKDISDVTGDKASGGRTLPMLIGTRNAAIFSLVLYAAACLLLLKCFNPHSFFVVKVLLYFVLTALLISGLLVAFAPTQHNVRLSRQISMAVFFVVMLLMLYLR